MLRVPTLHIQKAFLMVFICSEKNEMMKRKEKNFLPIFIFHHRFLCLPHGYKSFEQGLDFLNIAFTLIDPSGVFHKSSSPCTQSVTLFGNI